MDRPRVAIVIPALNEAASIGRIVTHASRHGLPIVVDDGSSDDTGRIARDAGADVVQHPQTRGYDQALESGFARATTIQCENVITLDGDGQHDPQLLSMFIQALETGADVVIGVRDKKQRVSERAFAIAAGCLWGVHDPLCGMKGYRLSLYRELGHFDSYGSIGTELALFAARAGRRIVEIPIVTRPRSGSSRFGQALSANWRIFRALVLSLRGRRTKWARP